VRKRCRMRRCHGRRTIMQLAAWNGQHAVGGGCVRLSKSSGGCPRAKRVGRKPHEPTRGCPSLKGREGEEQGDCKALHGVKLGRQMWGR
jgi:hypothetical protein